ncbi:MAG: DUF433 domain-containing protein [Bythopirellula sp.]|nr:DUF433 domain-containing protein [Bythopirellula sp.]
MDSTVVSVNMNIQGGTPCFTGTRVPVSSLFDHLEAGYTVDYFLSQFPSVKREQVTALLETAKLRTDQESRALAGR